MTGQLNVASNEFVTALQLDCTLSMHVQIDLRFTNPEEGSLEVVVAPVMRFKDISFNANVKIEDIAPPERIISGFALEIFGAPLQVSHATLAILFCLMSHLQSCVCFVLYL